MEPVGHSEEVLVVEDPMIQKLIRGILARAGYSAISLTAEEAAEQIRRGDSDVILITNRPEPFLAIAGSLRLLYISGCPDEELAFQFPHCRFLVKPFHPRDLVAALRELAAVAVT